MLLHVMAPEELEFAFDRWSRFECLESTGRLLDLDPHAIRKAYLQRVREFMENISNMCLEMKCDYMPVTTDQPLGETLAHYLNRRHLKGR